METFVFQRPQYSIFGHIFLSYFGHVYSNIKLNHLTDIDLAATRTAKKSAPATIAASRWIETLGMTTVSNTWEKVNIWQYGT